MNIFANRSIWKKILIVFFMILTISCIKPKTVKAASIGGELMEPICDFLVGFADGFMNASHHILIGQETTLIRVNLSDGVWDILRIAVTAVVFLLVLAAAAALTAGGAIAVGAVITALGGQVSAGIAASAIIANIVPILVGATYFGVKAYSMDAFDNEIDLPLYSISPERIFSNTIPLFDVNFFNPSAEPYKYQWIHKSSFEDKYQPIYGDSYLDFSNGQDVTTTEMKDRVCKSSDASIINPDLIIEIKKITFNGSTYFQVKRSGAMGAAPYNINLRETEDGQLKLAEDLDFSNAVDMTSEEIKELTSAGNINAEIVKNAKKIEVGGVQYIRFTTRRSNKYLSSRWSRRKQFIWNSRKAFIFT